MTDDEDDSTDENYPNTTNLIEEHFHYTAARENLQEFAGRVPQRKRKRESENSQDSNKPKVRKIFMFVRSPRVKCNTKSEKGTRCEGKKNTFTISHPRHFVKLVIIIGIEKK
jgi:hypothetical protein